jgi:hypothetical protein
MIHVVSHWNDLRQFGIEFLTGEACNVGKRLLCDVTEQGRRNLCSVFGLPSDCRFQESWNSGSDKDPHVGSIMIPYSMFSFLAAMLLLQQKTCFAAAATANGRIYGFETRDEYHQFFVGREDSKGCEIYVRQGDQPAVGLSNVHQFSGRAQ